ncbi:MAG: NIPSNAP family containing protein, partial [Acidimicrobiales bacterium]
EGWDGLVANFEHELSAPTMQDPSLAEWWATAAALRRGGVDRIVVPAPWTRSIEELTAAGVRGALYAHELVTVAPGRAMAYLDALETKGRAAVESLGLTLVGAWRVTMVNDSECIVIWAIPDWATWAAFEQAWEPGGALSSWRDEVTTMGADWRRIALVDAPLAPLRTGRQPNVEDRRPLSEL